MHGKLESSVGSSSAKSRPNSVLKRLRRALALAGIASAIIAGAATGQVVDKHPFGIDDYSALHSAHAIAVSPDGRNILYDVRTDGATGPTKHEWRLIDVSGEHSRKLDLPENLNLQDSRRTVRCSAPTESKNSDSWRSCRWQRASPRSLSRCRAAFTAHPFRQMDCGLPSWRMRAPEIRWTVCTPLSGTMRRACTSSARTEPTARGGVRI
jgi:hypothetical protein